MSTEAEDSECSVVHKLSRHVKAHSEADVIVDCLTLLKNEQERCHKQILKALDTLIRLLRYQNLRVLNLTLSILANASLATDVKVALQDTKVAAYTVWILKNLKMETSLQCRSCRLMGNLSESSHHAKAFFHAGAVKALVHLLKTKSNTSTYLMAVRATRNIWSNCEQSRDNILELNGISCISSIFAKSRIKSSQANHAELTEGCLKAMCKFLSNYDARCAEQMREGEYRDVVEFCKLSKNKFAVRCLCLLCRIAQCRPDLGKSGAIEVLVELLSRSEMISGDLVESLSMFCREALNRHRLQTGPGLEFMLDLLKNAEHEKHHPILLRALVNFEYNNDSIRVMAKNGLLEILTEKLRKMAVNRLIEEEEEEETKKKKKKDAKKRSPPPPINACHDRTKSSRYSLDYHHENWSPRSTTSGYSSSPSSTPPRLSLYDSGDSEEDDYSPVCSDEEDEPQEEEVESLKSCGSAGFEESDSSLEGILLRRNAQDSGAYSTLVLLSKLSCFDEAVDKLADPTTIEPLVAYMQSAKSHKASRILARIVRNRMYLVPLIKQGFAFEAQVIFGSEQYTRHLCDLAKTGGAVGELSSILLRGQESHKYVTAISIPFLISSRNLLKYLLKDHGGLSLIFQVLNEPSHRLHEKAIWSICRLAASLEIRPEGVEKNLVVDRRFSFDSDEKREIPGKPATVTFELDDGTTIDACRRTLCRKSDAFSAMLEGNFSESGKRRVKLQNASREGLRTLLMAAGGTDFENRAIESQLDAVLLADRFLMTDISGLLTDSSIAKLNHENFSRAWNWARVNSCSELQSCCVKTFLVSRMNGDERERAFRGFSSNEHFPEFLEETREIINNALWRRLPNQIL